MAKKTQWNFVCEEHADYSTTGWRLTNMPAFDPLPGMAVAHDILEHWPDDDSTTGELLALGAMIYVRGEDYYAHKGQSTISPGENCAGEIGDLLLKIESGEWVDLRETTGQRTCTKDEFARAEIATAIAQAKKHIREEREGTMPDSATWRTVRYWLTKGFNLARLRYRGIDRWELQRTFTEIESAADRELKSASIGDVLSVRLSWRNGEPKLSVAIDYDQTEDY